jgi:hypothetical protein
MNKQTEFIDYVQTFVIVRYSRCENETPGSAGHWAMDRLRQAYEVAPRIPEVLSAFQAAMQFTHLMFPDQRPARWHAPEWLCDVEAD